MRPVQNRVVAGCADTRLSSPGAWLELPLTIGASVPGVGGLGGRDTEFIARLAGDEFLVVFPECVASEAARVTERMLAATAEGLGASIGIAGWDGSVPDALVANADRAMYEAKAAGGGRIILADATIGA